MSVLSFLSQKTHPGEYLRAEVILSRSYLRKCCIYLPPPPAPTPPPILINFCHFLKMS